MTHKFYKCLFTCMYKISLSEKTLRCKVLKLSFTFSSNRTPTSDQKQVSFVNIFCEHNYKVHNYVWSLCRASLPLSMVFVYNPLNFNILYAIRLLITGQGNGFWIKNFNTESWHLETRTSSKSCHMKFITSALRDVSVSSFRLPVAMKGFFILKRNAWF